MQAARVVLGGNQACSASLDGAVIGAVINSVGLKTSGCAAHPETQNPYLLGNFWGVIINSFLNFARSQARTCGKLALTQRPFPEMMSLGWF